MWYNNFVFNFNNSYYLSLPKENNKPLFFDILFLYIPLVWLYEEIRKKKSLVASKHTHRKDEYKKRRRKKCRNPTIDASVEELHIQPCWANRKRRGKHVAWHCWHFKTTERSGLQTLRANFRLPPISIISFSGTLFGDITFTHLRGWIKSF